MESHWKVLIAVLVVLTGLGILLKSMDTGVDPGRMPSRLRRELNMALVTFRQALDRGEWNIEGVTTSELAATIAAAMNAAGEGATEEEKESSGQLTRRHWEWTTHKPTKPYQIFVIGDDVTSTIRLEAYAENLEKPAVVKEFEMEY